MAKSKDKGVEIRKLGSVKPGVIVGKPAKIAITAMRAKVANGGVGMAGGTVMGSGGNFYSPELSTDFLKLPQSVDERRNYIRFFYKNDPFVGQAIDLHVELPLSKLRILKPKARNKALAEKAYRFCERWAKRVRLLHRLIEIRHEYCLLGEAYVFCEDLSPDLPEDVRTYPVKAVDEETGEITETRKEYDDADDREVLWLKKNYKGWTSVRVLPPENVHMEAFPFTDERLFELVLDSKTKDIINRANDPEDVLARKIVESMPADIVDSAISSKGLSLNTDPDAGSFVHYFARKRSQYEEHGSSMLERCLRLLVFRDEIRQSMSSIASRHMTPYRLVSAENLNDDQVEELRGQVDLALQDPDFSVITNFKVDWQEMGADQRLPDWSWVWEFTDRQLYAGLGVTESLLSGESSYAGDRINLEVINTRYMLDRELMKNLVEDYFFKPMCRRMGFVEEDEDGNMEVIVPTLSFTRLALRDSSDTYEHLFALYQKGSLDIDTIYDLLNLDSDTVREKLEKDMYTLMDAGFNEVLRSAYSQAGGELVANSDLVSRIADGANLKYVKPQAEGTARFG